MNPEIYEFISKVSNGLLLITFGIIAYFLKDLITELKSLGKMFQYFEITYKVSETNNMNRWDNSEREHKYIDDKLIKQAVSLEGNHRLLVEHSSVLESHSQKID